MAQYEDIKQKIQSGMSDRQIAKAIGRRRQLIAEIRKGTFQFTNNPELPSWMEQVNWDEVLKDFRKHPISFIWEEYAAELTSYCNFTKYIYKKYPYLKSKDYTHRDFSPGERVEVDWSGDTIEWVNPVDGKINKAYVFVSCLGYSQLFFAKAFSTMKQIDFLLAHEAMFNFYQGVPQVIIPDNAKTAVIKTHRYDPDLNPEYDQFTKHYAITVAPARAYTPKDKALVEGAVKIFQRYFKWRYRKMTFTSLKEINDAIFETIKLINSKKHTRFKISRDQMFNEDEKSHLKELPEKKYELCETKFCKVHPDGTIAYKYQFYSVPYQLVKETVLVKSYSNTIEIYHKLDKVAVHAKLGGRRGRRSIESAHLPEAAQVYRGTTVQSIIQQSVFISPELNIFISQFLEENPCGNIRRAQGFIREAKNFRGKANNDIFKLAVKRSIEQMQLFNNIRVNSFRMHMQENYKLLIEQPKQDRIIRDNNNPMLRRNTICIH